MELKDFSDLFFKDFDGFNFILRTGLTDAIQLSIEIPKKIKCQFFPDMKIHAGIESVKKKIGTE